MKYQTAKKIATFILIQICISQGNYLLVDVNEKGVEDVDSTWTGTKAVSHRTLSPGNMRLQY